MNKIFYCRKCVFPNTKPHLLFDDNGVCSACTYHENRNVNWKKREEAFHELVKNVKRYNREYDCVVPVSGGKDSIYQVIKAKQYGLHILAVHVDYGIKTEEGIHNLNIISDKLGIDILSFKPGNYHKRLIKLAFTKYGDPDVFNHALLYAYPVTIAKNKNIPLVLFGENPSSEYIGCKEEVSEQWVYKHVINERFWNDFYQFYLFEFVNYISNYVIPMVYYNKIKFLGDYFKWDSEKHMKIVKQLGFKTPSSVAGTYRNWVGIDEVIHRVHQFMKVIVLGYGRATDHACEDIRQGKCTRQQAINKIKAYECTSLSHRIKIEFCDYINITVKEFDSIIDKFRNPLFWPGYNEALFKFMHRPFWKFKE